MSSSDAPADPASFLDRTAARTRERFVHEKTLLSFAEYLDVVAQRPTEQSRDAAMYLRDVFLHFGTETVQRPYGRFTRYGLFDCPFDGGRDRLIGHEAVQEAVFGLLTDFVKDGRVSKLILLHGPNGSAKSSFISCIMRAMEAYSALPEGAQYTFNWVSRRASCRAATSASGASGPCATSTATRTCPRATSTRASAPRRATTPCCCCPAPSASSSCARSSGPTPPCRAS